MNKMRLADGREIADHYTPGQVKDWLTPKIGPNGVETFEPYNNMHPVRLAESFVTYADRTRRRIKELELANSELREQVQYLSNAVVLLQAAPK